MMGTSKDGVYLSEGAIIGMKFHSDGITLRLRRHSTGTIYRLKLAGEMRQETDVEAIRFPMNGLKPWYERLFGWRKY